MYYVEKIGDALFDREAEVLGEVERCAVCHGIAEGHDRPRRKHAYTPEAGLALRVTFPTNRRPGLPAEIVEYPFVAPGTGPNQYHD